VVPQFPKGHPLDMHLFLTEQPEWRAAAQAEQPIWVASDVPLAEPGVTREFDYVYRPSEVGAGSGAGSWDAACSCGCWCQPGVHSAAATSLFVVGYVVWPDLQAPDCCTLPWVAQAVQNNGSVYVHLVFTPTGASPNPTGEPPLPSAAALCTPATASICLIRQSSHRSPPGPSACLPACRRLL
jgi:hypothetical protein